MLMYRLIPSEPPKLLTIRIETRSGLIIHETAAGSIVPSVIASVFNV